MERKRKKLILLIPFLLLITVRMDNVIISEPLDNIKIETRIITKKSELEFQGIPEEILGKYVNKSKEMQEILPFIIEGCRKHNISERFVLAIAILESGWGKSEVAKQCKNYFGLGGKNAIDFSELSLGDAILESISIIKKDYPEETIEKISRRYCKPSAYWYNQIMEIQEEIWK